MKLFQCQNCGQLLYFENTICVKCGHALGYLPAQNSLLTLTPTQDNRWLAANAPSIAYRYCANFAYGACNWLVAADDVEPFCLACQLNRTIPDVNQAAYVERWQKLENAKHRLIYALLQFNLPVISKAVDDEWGLAFDFLAADAATEQSKPVTTGHADGVITINIAEADDANREQIRQSLAEPYRTILGHFRHEIAHYYWMRFAQSQEWIDGFRQHFGDERADYGTSLAQHYTNPPSEQWRNNFISSYAEAHPWEDWAETWAHYLHLVDTLETAYTFGIQVRPQLGTDASLSTNMTFNAYEQSDFERLINNWLPITFAVNSLNRSMGQPDLYPFVLTQAVLTKMAYVHNSIRADIKNQILTA